MMLGSGNPVPTDNYALLVIGALAIVLLIGCLIGDRWLSPIATLFRWGALILTAAIVAAVYLVTPSASGIIGAGRMLTFLPAAALVTTLFCVWSWRLGHF